MRPGRSSSGRSQPRFARGWCIGIALLCGLRPVGASAQTPSVGDSTVLEGSASGECCMVLLLPLGGRVVALGRAVVADTSADEPLSNPAGLVGLKKAEFLLHYRKLPLDEQVVGLSFVTRPFSFGAFAFSYTLVDLGADTLTDEYGSVLGTSYTQMHAISGTFATALGAGVAAGLTYRLYIENTPCDTCATGGAGGGTQLVDVGVQWHPHWLKGFGVGAALANAGIPLQIVNYEQADRPPLRVRTGITMEVLHLLTHASGFTGTLFGQVDGGGADGLVPAIGAEAIVGGVVALRGGWRGKGSSPQTYLDGGGVAGIGLMLDRLDLSVARALSSSPLESDSPFQITFGVTF